MSNVTLFGSRHRINNFAADNSQDFGLILASQIFMQGLTKAFGDDAPPFEMEMKSSGDSLQIKVRDGRFRKYTYKGLTGFAENLSQNLKR